MVHTPRYIVTIKNLFIHGMIHSAYQENAMYKLILIISGSWQTVQTKIAASHLGLCCLPHPCFGRLGMDG